MFSRLSSLIQIKVFKDELPVHSAKQFFLAAY
jgi:hypothetical protein